MKLIVDSTCDLPKEWIEKFQIGIIPLQVTIDGKNYLDKVNIQTKQVYEAIRAGKKCLTALPRVEDLYQQFTDCAKKEQDFMFLSFSSKMSGTYQLAANMIQELKEEFPSINMVAVDSKAGALGTGLIALKIAEKNQAGFSFEELVSYAKDRIQHIQHIFMLNNLDQLAAGGRISKLGAMAGNTLKIRPILHVVDGEIKLLSQVRGNKKAWNKLIESVDQKIGPIDQTIGIAYADDQNLADIVSKLLQEKIGAANFIFENIGSVLSTHIGLESVGIFFFDDQEK